jgi:hypothetical protein
MFWNIAPCSQYVNLLHTAFLKIEGILSSEKLVHVGLHGAIFQRVATLITTAVKTSDPSG